MPDSSPGGKDSDGMHVVEILPSRLSACACFLLFTYFLLGGPVHDGAASLAYFCTVRAWELVSCSCALFLVPCEGARGTSGTVVSDSVFLVCVGEISPFWVVFVLKVVLSFVLCFLLREYSGCICIA